MEFELQQVKSYNLDKGIVTIYVVDDVYLVTYDDESNEIIWGFGYTPKHALITAQREWEPSHFGCLLSIASLLLFV